MEGEVVLLDERDWQYLHLNGSAAELWRLLVDGATADAMAEALVATFSIDPSVAQRDVDAFLTDLGARELVVQV